MEQVVAQSALQHQDHLEASKVARRIDLCAIGSFVGEQRQLGQFNRIVDDQRLLGIPLKDEVVGGVRH